MEILQYLNLARRWAWLLILGVVLGAAGGYYFSNLQTPIYSVSTKLMVGSSQQVGSQYDYMSSYNAQQLALTYVELLKTKPLLATISKRLGYPVSSITPTLLPNTQVIQIQVQDTDPQHAMDIANTTVTVLIEQNETLQAGRYVTTETSLQTQVDQVQKQISTLQGDITKISQQSIQDQLDQVSAQIAPLQDESTQLQKEIAVLETQNASYKFPTTEDKAQIAANNALIIEKKNRISQLVPLINQYQQVYSNLLILGQSNTNGSKSNIQLTQLQSTLNVYQQLYINLLSSLESVRLSRTQNTPTVTHIEPATLPLSPISPKPWTNAASTGAVGLLLAASAVFLIEYLDDTIKTPEQVEQILGLTVLGYIAEVPKTKLDDHGLFVSSKPRSPVAEAFRSLRTNLEYSSIDHPLRTILITSSGPGEGKSTVAANLTAIIAQSGKPVALLDADLRRPSIHHFFRITNRVGLSDVFRGHLDLDAVKNTWEGDENISVFTSGSLPPNPTELLASEKMTQILDQLKEHQNTIIVDSPPTLVTDPQVLAAKVDGVVIVVWPNHTQMNGLRATLEQLNRVNANVVGLIFNRIPQNPLRYYGGYKHYSQYYYRNYRYHSDDAGFEATSKEK
jgi:capsular exopolysaccharide synthesis family protein